MSLIFPETTVKQWKQFLQFELNGVDYNSLIFNSHEDIPILPFYSSENNICGIQTNRESFSSEVMIPLYCSNVEQTLKRIHFWIEKGITSFFITLGSQSSNTNYFVFFKKLPHNIRFFVKIDGLPFELQRELHTVINSLAIDIILCADSISVALEKGFLLPRGKNFPLPLVSKKHHEETAFLFVDTSLYQNAGASVIQQVAYGIAHTVTYLDDIEVYLPCKKIELFVKVAIGMNWLLEISKLNAFKQLAENVFTSYPFKITIHLMAEPSDRSLSLSKSTYNENCIYSAYEIAILGGVNFLIPKNQTIFKKNTLENEQKHVLKIREIINFRNHSVLSKNHCFETLSYEISKKALVLLQNMEKKGSLFTQIKNSELQDKIKEKAFQEQVYFEEKIKEIGFDFASFAKESEWELYPFSRIKQTKKNIKPLIPNRLWENIEKERT